MRNYDYGVAYSLNLNEHSEMMKRGDLKERLRQLSLKSAEQNRMIASSLTRLDENSRSFEKDSSTVMTATGTGMPNTLPTSFTRRDTQLPKKNEVSMSAQRPVACLPKHASKTFSFLSRFDALEKLSDSML
ncbi:hypothetical protein AB6A40_000277 [Gnathostoma spinigerum]|uniref:Uncharacterized protein n=1 Tax=Gnathostoma spinigerum TaxID=75299 RepID=A0ABD6E1V3_9BILA